MKRRFKNHEVDTLMLVGSMLAGFSKREDTWILFEAHRLDKQFDIEFALMPGLPLVFYEQDTAETHVVHQFTEAIAKAFPNSEYSKDHLTAWKKRVENGYLKDFRFTPDNAIHVATLLEEKEFVRELLPGWKEQRSQFWTEEQAMRFILYSNDTEYEIEALELYTSLFDNDVGWIVKKSLLKKYIEEKMNEKAIPLLCALLKREIESDGIFIDYLESLCDILIAAKGKPNPLVREALGFVRSINKANRNFTPPVIASFERLRKVYPHQL